jgi:hypothetical protein
LGQFLFSNLTRECGALRLENETRPLWFGAWNAAFDHEYFDAAKKVCKIADAALDGAGAAA